MTMPWSKFFWSDYASDPALKLCSLAAQGLWMRMLCIATEHDPPGYVAVNGEPLAHEDLARATGASLEECERLTFELERRGVFSRDRRGWIYSRRIVAEVRSRKKAKEFGNLGGNPKLKGGYNMPGFVYLIGPRSDGAYKIGISVNPKQRLKRLREQHRGQGLALIDAWACPDMGALEAELHSKFRGKGQGEWFFLNGEDLCELRNFCAPLKGEGKGPSKGPPNPQKPEARVHSVDKSTGAKSAPENDPEGNDFDPVKALFDDGIRILGKAGISEKSARSLIGRWRKEQRDDDAVALAIAMVESRNISQPLEWIPKFLASRAHGQPNGSGSRSGSSFMDIVEQEHADAAKGGRR